jgi:hypothetical protein
MYVKQKTMIAKHKPFNSVHKDYFEQFPKQNVFTKIHLLDEQFRCKDLIKKQNSVKTNFAAALFFMCFRKMFLGNCWKSSLCTELYGLFSFAIILFFLNMHFKTKNLILKITLLPWNRHEQWIGPVGVGIEGARER